MSLKMNRKKYIDRITDALGILAHQVKAGNSIRLFDKNIHAEYFFKELLNLAYGFRLENLNIADGRNTTAIDLGDKNSKTAVQVTSETRSTKIHDTIKKFLEKNLFHDYNRLVFLIISFEGKNYSTSFDTQDRFVFSKENDILFLKDLLSHISNMKTHALLEVASFLEDELIPLTSQSNNSESSEVETIIKLIEYLSENRTFDELKEEKEPDPEHKIFKRFSDHSSYLIKSYKNLASFYSTAVTEAKDVSGLDTGTVRLIALYLMDISDRFLTECDGNPRSALDKLTNFFDDKIGSSGGKYERMAIKFYLLSELINCNVFPNEEEL